MLNPQSYALGATRSCIRELFEYGKSRAAIVGPENIFDFSLGNPSIPAPPEVNAAIREVLEDTPSLAIHGYTSSAGDLQTRQAIADDLSTRYGAQVAPEDLFIGCGAAPELTAVFRALAVPGAEIVAIAPFFPEYRPFVEQAGATFRVVPADIPDFQIRMDALEEILTSNTVAVIINSPNNPAGTVYSAETLEKLGALLTKKHSSLAIPFTSSPMSPTGNCVTEAPYPSCRPSIRTRWCAIPTPSPCPCPGSGSAISMCPGRQPTHRRCMPPSPVHPGESGMCAPRRCCKKSSPGAPTCARILTAMTATAGPCMKVWLLRVMKWQSRKVRSIFL